MNTPILIQLLEEPAIAGIEAVQKLSLKLVARLAIDLVALLLLLRFVYTPNYKKRDLHFTFIIFNLVIFLICFLLNKVELSMGAAFGLFAVFSMLRYRTEEISIKDMTWLFLVIGIGLVNAVTKIKDASDGYEYLFLGIINILIFILAFVLEGRFIIKKESSRVVSYEKIELLHASQKTALLEDLKLRTGLDVQRVSVIRMDLVNDSALLKIYYRSEEH